MARTDPFMVEDDDDEEDDSDSEGRSAKRPRKGGGGFSSGFTATAEGDADTAESQLEAMLAAEGGPTAAIGGVPPSSGFSGVLGMGGAAAGLGAGANLPPGLGLPGSLAAGLSLSGESKVATTPMDFSRLVANMPSREIPVPKNLVECLMTPENRSILSEESGADVEWAPEDAQAKLRGSQEQIKKATRLLQRVLMHCHWGRSEAKVRRLMRPDIIESAICRLSPMNTLRPAERNLNTSQPIMTIGKDKANDVVIQDPVISRQHCVLELDPERGAVYAIDTSTNGTFLNGIRLPAKTVGKVLVSHGDELLFKDPAGGDSEFGYIVNLNELHVKRYVKLDAPRRILSPEEMSTAVRDFS